MFVLFESWRALSCDIVIRENILLFPIKNIYIYIFFFFFCILKLFIFLINILTFIHIE